VNGNVDERGKADILSLEKASKNIHQIYIPEYLNMSQF
jgi:hypothetical protein